MTRMIWSLHLSSTEPVRDHLLAKMYSMPMPTVGDARYDTKDFKDEYDDSALLKVREQMTCHVTKEIPQRGAATTTCTGPLCGEKAGEKWPCSRHGLTACASSSTR